MEKLYQVWVKLESGWFGHGAAESGLGETESGWFGHGAAESSLGETESGLFGKWRS